MTSLQDLLAKRAVLEQEIQNTQKRERSDALSKIKLLMEQYDLSSADISHKASAKPAGNRSGKVAAKYRDNTGNQWSGRGLQPKWLKAALVAGKTLNDFRI
jgi:DNA-binding protein H-NS